MAKKASPTKSRRTASTDTGRKGKVKGKPKKSSGPTPARKTKRDIWPGKTLNRVNEGMEGLFFPELPGKGKRSTKSLLGLRRKEKTPGSKKPKLTKGSSTTVKGGRKRSPRKRKK